MEKQTQISPPSQKPSALIQSSLAQMAILRGATVEPSTLRLYSRKLEHEKLEDVIVAIEKIGEIPRGEGELAFPEVGTILSVVRAVRVARYNREKAEREYYQQQVCPKCNGVVGMIRPRGHQFRTFCKGCQQYRKIMPEDLKLTPHEWDLLCAELGIIYRDWVRRGSKPSECIDPQFDRELVRGCA